jgi:hypothetical protein
MIVITCPTAIPRRIPIKKGGNDTHLIFVLNSYVLKKSYGRVSVSAPGYILISRKGFFDVGGHETALHTLPSKETPSREKNCGVKGKTRSVSGELKPRPTAYLLSVVVELIL